MVQCVHPRFHFQLHVKEIADTDLRCVEIVAQCIECGRQAIFKNLESERTPGSEYANPSMTPDGNHAFLPFRLEGDIAILN